jgi:hypothetical protein
MALQGMRDLARASMGRSLRGLSEEDKLAAAWPVACGKAMAERGVVVGYVDGIVWLQVADDVWMRQMMSMRTQLAGEMARIAQVEVREIHFELKRNSGR